MLAELQKQCGGYESEIEVLKEMVRGSQMQIKSKETDIQRLQIKIKRLEKEALIKVQDYVPTPSLEANSKVSPKRPSI